MARRIVAALGVQIFETDGQKYIATNLFRTNGRSALLRNDMRDFHL